MPVIKKTYHQETPPDIKKMQQDAIKRVREMQKRAKNTLEQSAPLSNQNTPDKPKCHPSENNKENFNNQNSNSKQSKQNQYANHKKNHNFINSLPSLVEPLFKDKEKSIILILILILMGEKDEGNLEIILVLFYILYS